MKKTFPLVFKKTLSIFLFLVFILNVRAQEIPVTFKIINQKKEPVGFATVTVINRTDTLKNEKKISDSSGILTFTLITRNQYLVSVSSVNYQAIEKGITVAPGQHSFTFQLEEASKTLSGVVVTSSKPLMKQED